MSDQISTSTSNATLPETAKAALKILAQHLEAIDASIAALDQEIATVHAQNPVCRLLAGIPGIGKLAASAIVASVPDPKVFKSGRDFSAWLGSTPRQNSSGGKEKLGSITKQGNHYIRRLLVLGATSLLRVAGKRKGALRDWLIALLARKPARLVTVALANKLARIIWAIMTTGETFRMEIFARA
jgi:transposase